MSARVDTRDVVERATDAVTAAELEMRTGVQLHRCECGATLIVVDELGRRCAGCGVDLHPGASIPNAMGERGRDQRSPDPSAASLVACKGVPAPGYSGGRVAALSAGLTARLARLFLAGWRA